jgi:hypothetical protein
MMRFQSGKFKDKTYEEVLLKHSDWVQWYMGKYPDSSVARKFVQLIRKFDKKPFVAKCEGCSRPATRASVYRNSPSLMFWCHKCQPHSSGAEKSKVQAVTTLQEVLDHIDQTANGVRAWKRKIVRQLAEGKGLPKKVGEKSAATFFAS